MEYVPKHNTENHFESRVSSLGLAGVVGGGSEYTALSILNTTTEVPLSKAPNPQLLPGSRSINGCPLRRVCVHSVCVCVCVFTAVCVHLGWVTVEHKFRVWEYLAVCHFLLVFLFKQGTFPLIIDIMSAIVVFTM